MIRDEELEGRQPKGTSRNKHSVDLDGKRLDTAVFDKARARSPNPLHNIGFYAAGPNPVVFKRTEADARPFKVVPFHEPDPDRIAKAEALRLRLAAQDEERMARGVSPDVVYASRERHKAASWARPKRIPIVLNPDTSECCSPEVAVVKAERGERTLYWRSLRDAEAAFGAPPGKRRIEPSLVPSNAMSDPYGWRWSRLADARRDNGGQNKR